MIRQAHTYLFGAVSGTVLIAVAVIVFVMLVSAQALRNWPVSDLGFGSDSSSESVAPARPASQAAAAASTGGETVATNGRSASTGKVKQTDGATPASPSEPGIAAATAGETPSPTPASRTPGPKAPEPKAAEAPASVGSSPTGGSPGGGSKSIGPIGSTPSPSSVSGSVAGAVHETVGGVDEALGGALKEGGVTKVTEGAVNGLAGPDSVVGRTLDEVVGTTGQLLEGGQ